MSIQVLPVAVLDGIFIFWVFTSLSKTLAQLQTRRAGAKLELYRRVPAHAGAFLAFYQLQICECAPEALASQGAGGILQGMSWRVCFTRRFTNTLALMVWVSVAWIAYEMYFKVRRAAALCVFCLVRACLPPVLPAHALHAAPGDGPVQPQVAMGLDHRRLLVRALR